MLGGILSSNQQKKTDNKTTGQKAESIMCVSLVYKNIFSVLNLLLAARMYTDEVYLAKYFFKKYIYIYLIKNGHMKAIKDL